VGGGGNKERVNEDEYGMYFVSIYKNRRGKPVECGEREIEQWRGAGVNLTKIYCKHI
jgi:hypothetical protein